MPTYEYRRADGTTFELVQSITSEPLTHDPETGQPVQKVLHAPAVHFKGSGFYNTDYGTRKRSKELKEAGEGSSSANGSGDGGKDGGGRGEDKSSSTAKGSDAGGGEKASSSSSTSTSSSKSESSKPESSKSGSSSSGSRSD